MTRAYILFLPFALPLLLHATQWTVGPGLTYTAPSQVSTLVGDGDTVNIQAAVYPGDVARWAANDLLLRGVGGLAHLESDGNAWGGKAIWVIQGDRTTVEWIEFSECSVPDHNGAGIRQEGHDLSVRYCYFHNNENGILAGTVNPSTIRIEYTEFGYNGYGDGQTHNLYINNVDSLIFRYNYSHHAHVGHELKSRAHVNVIEYNRLSNEADGDASREIDLPNGGTTYLIGNVIQQGPQGQNSNLVGFGMEGLSNPAPHALYAINNTLVNEKTVGSFFQSPAGIYLKAYNNVLAGGGSFMSAWPTDIDTLGNLRSSAIAALQFLDPGNYDYRIDANSPAHNAGFPAGLANGGYPLVALWEYVHPTDGVLRCQHATLDAGAFETCTTNMGSPTMDVGMYLWPNPTTGTLHLCFGNKAPIARIELRDVRGLLLRAVPRTTRELDLQYLADGVYFLQVVTPSGSLSQRFVKY